MNTRKVFQIFLGLYNNVSRMTEIHAQYSHQIHRKYNLMFYHLKLHIQNSRNVSFLPCQVYTLPFLLQPSSVVVPFQKKKLDLFVPLPALWILIHLPPSHVYPNFLMSETGMRHCPYHCSISEFS